MQNLHRYLYSVRTLFVRWVDHSCVGSRVRAESGRAILPEAKQQPRAPRRMLVAVPVVLVYYVEVLLLFCVSHTTTGRVERFW